ALDGLQRQRDLGAGGDDDAFGRALAVQQHVAAATDALERRRITRQLRYALARERQRRGAAVVLDGRAPGHRGLDGIGRTPQRQVRQHTQAVQLLDRLVRRTILAQTD